MTDKIKKFFNKKKADAKFRLAGPGRRLTDEPSSSSQSRIKSPYVPKPREALSEESKQAAEAALARLAGQKKDSKFNTSLAAIQAQVRRELEAEKKKLQEHEEEPPRSLLQPKHSCELDVPENMAVSGVYFRCPLISNDVLTKDEWKGKIKEFLYEQLEDERGLTACLIIHSCNKSREKVKECIDTLCKYLENIIANPDDEKFQRIRMSNKIFSDKVQSIEGTSDFLYAAGFRQKRMVVNDLEDDYLVFDRCNLNAASTLEMLCDALRSAEPIPLELDRTLQVLMPSQATRKIELPRDFFAISPEELKKEQQLRAEAAERNMQLRTKAMREKDELRDMRKYRFALIRVRFPDGLFLQGTFAVFEPVNAVMEFVRENIHHGDLPFNLTIPTVGHKINVEEDGEKSLIDMRLVPASVLIFEWDPNFADAINAVSTSALKSEILLLVQPM